MESLCGVAAALEGQPVFIKITLKSFGCPIIMIGNGKYFCSFRYITIMSTEGTGEFMEYMSALQAAGYMWLIPSDAKEPIDRRIKWERSITNETAVFIGR